LLFDPATAPLSQKKDYAEVMTHELAHQWFGDLVTTAWWNDIWLNEAFATWMAAKAEDAWDPSLDAAGGLREGIQRAMGEDALVSARSIRQPIESEDDIENAFDDITYQKGAGVIGMFERWVGEDTFQRGVHAYLEAHRFGSATADDFLAALSSAAGKDVGGPFRTFLDQPGVPLLQAEVACDGAPRLRLRQSRYLPKGSSGTKWGRGRRGRAKRALSSRRARGTCRSARRARAGCSPTPARAATTASRSTRATPRAWVKRGIRRSPRPIA
jgi:alanyl aminopeptidase